MPRVRGTAKFRASIYLVRGRMHWLITSAVIYRPVYVYKQTHEHGRNSQKTGRERQRESTLYEHGDRVINYKKLVAFEAIPAKPLVKFAVYPPELSGPVAVQLCYCSSDC